MPTLQWIAVDALQANPRNARTHSKKQIRQIADSIATFGFVVPILIDESCVTIAGHGRYAALWKLGHHRILCGDARKPDTLKRLMGESHAAMAFLDPPYNVPATSWAAAGSSIPNSPWHPVSSREQASLNF